MTMMMGTGSSARALMIIALGCIVVAQIAVAAEAEGASEPLVAASSEVVLKDFGPSGYVELPGITRVKPFWRGRKLLAQKCDLGDVAVTVDLMGLTNGCDVYEIEINFDGCINPNCKIHNIHVYCPGFVTLDVGPNVFKHVSANDCIVLDGGYLGWRSRVRMQYIDNENLRPVLRPLSATITGC